jgi:hypothetical protein
VYVSDGHHNEKYGCRYKNQVKHDGILSCRLLGCLILMGRPSYGPDRLAAAEPKFACPGARAVFVLFPPDVGLQLQSLSLTAAPWRCHARGLRF